MRFCKLFVKSPSKKHTYTFIFLSPLPTIKKHVPFLNFLFWAYDTFTSVETFYIKILMTSEPHIHVKMLIDRYELIDIIAYVGLAEVLSQITTTGRINHRIKRGKATISGDFSKSVGTLRLSLPPPRTLLYAFGSPFPSSWSVHIFWMAPCKVCWLFLTNNSSKFFLHSICNPI